jgi:alkylated DNA repair dioxygenase AlkB
MRVEGAFSLEVEVFHGVRVDFFPRFLALAEADALLATLLATEMSPEVVRLFGTDFVTARCTVQYGAPYNFNPKAKPPLEWTRPMEDIRTRVEDVAGLLPSALVQLYPDGRAGLGWHRDKGRPEVIASVSLGAERDFVFGVQEGRTIRETWRMRLPHGSLLVVPGDTNNALKHRVPESVSVSQPRVNITFRRFPL